MNGTIVATLYQGDAELGDYSLPADITIEELCFRLLSVLAREHKRRFEGWKALGLTMNDYRLSESTATLKDYGIASGNRLMVIRTE